MKKKKTIKKALLKESILKKKYISQNRVRIIKKQKNWLNRKKENLTTHENLL